MKKTSQKRALGRVTGENIRRFKLENALSDIVIGALFGVSPNKMKAILSSGNEGVQDPVICYLYRQYIENPSLVPSSVSLTKFYEDIGGKDTISGSDFSLMLGRELTAYIRYFRGGSPTPSMAIMIQNAFRLSDGDSIDAFHAIQALCRAEGDSRGFDPLETKTWRDNTESKKENS